MPICALFDRTWFEDHVFWTSIQIHCPRRSQLPTFPTEPGDVVGLALAVPVEVGVLDARLAGGAVALVGGVVLDARDDLLLAGHPVADEGPDAGVVLGVHARLAAVSEGGKDSDDTGLAWGLLVG